MLKIIIIEDEKLTALDLAETIKKVDSDVEIQVILPSVEQSIKYLKENDNFDLIFSDIQLSDGLSFDIFKSVKISKPIIFCTAFNQYALEAFNTNGIEYILKPFSKASVSKALDKYVSLKSAFTTHSEPSFDSILMKLEQQIFQKQSSIILNQGDKIIPLETQKIALFFLEDDYVFAFDFDGKKYIVNNKLDELESICGSSFFRANRQFLVNRKAIKDASRFLNRKILVNITINFPEQIIVGKLKTTQFIDWLSKN